MSSISFLQNCPREEVTWERILEIVGQNSPEGLTLEYKESHSNRVVETIAAFANTYGGLLLIGIKDKAGSDRIVGVSEIAINEISNSCIDLLDPPFVPDIIPIPLEDNGSLYVLVIRVHPESSTRPVVIGGKVFVRLPARNARADSRRIRQLFSENFTSTIVANSYLAAPGDSFDDPPMDLYIRTGLVCPVNPSSAGRPFSETPTRTLANLLNESPVQTFLLQTMESVGLNGLSDFHKEGFNRSRNLRLAWQAITSFQGNHFYPIECIFTINSSSQTTQPPSAMIATLDIKFRRTAHQRREHSTQWGSESTFTISPLELYRGIKSSLETMSDEAIRALLAEFGGIEVYQIPFPVNMHILMPYGVTKTLKDQNLRQIPDAGFSGGTVLLGDQTLNLGNSVELHKQVQQWMIQFAQDAGLEGMESIIGSSPFQI